MLSFAAIPKKEIGQEEARKIDGLKKVEELERAAADTVQLMRGTCPDSFLL